MGMLYNLYVYQYTCLSIYTQGNSNYTSILNQKSTQSKEKWREELLKQLTKEWSYLCWLELQYAHEFDSPRKQIKKLKNEREKYVIKIELDRSLDTKVWRTISLITYSMLLKNMYTYSHMRHIRTQAWTIRWNAQARGLNQHITALKGRKGKLETDKKQLSDIFSYLKQTPHHLTHEDSVKSPFHEEKGHNYDGYGEDESITSELSHSMYHNIIYY